MDLCSIDLMEKKQLWCRTTDRNDMCVLIFGTKGKEIHFGPVEVEERKVRHSGQLETVGRNYKEFCASLPWDARSDQFDENEVDVKMPAVR